MCLMKFQWFRYFEGTTLESLLRRSFTRETRSRYELLVSAICQQTRFLRLSDSPERSWLYLKTTPNNSLHLAQRRKPKTTI